jgi:TPR repeat protein
MSNLILTLSRNTLLICGLLVCPALQADPMAEAPDAVEQFFNKPQSVDAAELFKRGKLYDKGEGIPQDKAKALDLYHKAAELNYAEAQLLLGIIYDQGIGVTQDYAQALSWYRRAAEQGYAKAQFNLGAMYDEGLGVPQNFTQAANWYRSAAEQGYANAQFNLGAMYLNGEGVAPDNIEGYMWLKLAADQGFATKVKALTSLVKSLTSAEMKQAKKRAKEWQKNHTHTALPTE